ADPVLTTVSEYLAWSYANLAMADAALGDQAERHGRTHFAIRNKLCHGLVSGTMSMRSLCHDERLKMTLPQACYYCGSNANLAVDHLIPRIKGGPDEADNLVWACRSCNSSKQGRDMLEWMRLNESFPSVWLLRRYIKLAARYCAR
ncbi:MAG: HNH endonuclease, partial [Thermoleophilia bacterium]